MYITISTYITLADNCVIWAILFGKDRREQEKSTRDRRKKGRIKNRGEEKEEEDKQNGTEK